jgi:hypothetical protein
MWRQQQKRQDVTIVSTIDEEAKKKTAFDYRTVGVRQTASMKWVSEEKLYPSPLPLFFIYSKNRHASYSEQLRRWRYRSKVNCATWVSVVDQLSYDCDNGIHALTVFE